MARLKADLTALNRQLSAGLQKAAAEFDGQFRDAIEADVYPWPRATIRSNGQRVTSPRDIVDTGRFRDSQTYSVSGLTASFGWSAIDPGSGFDYAPSIFYGYTTSTGLEVPGRDFISEAFRRKAPVETLAEEIRNA